MMAETKGNGETKAVVMVLLERRVLTKGVLPGLRCASVCACSCARVCALLRPLSSKGSFLVSQFEKERMRLKVDMETQNWQHTKK